MSKGKKKDNQIVQEPYLLTQIYDRGNLYYHQNFPLILDQF